MTAPAVPLIIAHRGASGELPEHTIAAYERAIALGADYIEPDLVMTKDGILVARHENEISGTTDVADRPEFADRRTTKTIDGRQVTGFFTEDFTFDELRRLRTRERLPQLRGTAYDGRYSIPPFADIVALAQARGVGIYPETKHPSYFAGIGLPLEPPLLHELAKAGWTDADAPVFIQSFETANLKALARRTGIRLVQLISAPDEAVPDGGGVSYADLLTPTGLAAIREYAVGIGPNKKLVIDEGRDTGLTKAAHNAGLVVHPWTFRAENVFLPAEFQGGDDPDGRGDIAAEICAHVAVGVDGLFADHVAEAVAARRGC
nr:glycerophosphodiester phosphodiesterase family protein [Pacificimonas pallii]